MPLLLSVIFTVVNKHTSFECYGINYSRNKVYETGPRAVCGLGSTSGQLQLAKLVVNSDCRPQNRSAFSPCVLLVRFHRAFCQCKDRLKVRFVGFRTVRNDVSKFRNLHGDEFRRSGPDGADDAVGLRRRPSESDDAVSKSNTHPEQRSGGQEPRSSKSGTTLHFLHTQ